MNRSNPSEIGRSKQGSDFLQLDPGEAPVGGLSDWLTNHLRAAISDGRLPIGTRLPSTRTLAAELNLSRGVVTEAYQRLTEDGQVEGRGRAGTIVVSAPPATASGGTAGGPAAGTGGAPTAGRANGRANGTQSGRTRRPVVGGAAAAAGVARLEPRPRGGPGVEVFDELREVPARIDLTPGVPDLGAFPRGAWLRGERVVLGQLESGAFGYGDPAGTLALRQAVVTWLARNRGVAAEADEVIIVAGVAQAIGLVAQVLEQHGISQIAVEDPGSLGSRQHLRLWGMETPPIPVDTRGLRVDVLRESRAPAVMVTPAHHFPMGVVLEGERRRELLAWAADGGLVIEDDYDAEHRYDRPPVPALRAMLPDQVIYTGSISKLLAPSLRIGWMVSPPQYRDELIAMKRLADLGNAALPQLTLAHLMANGDLERHLRLVRRRHRTRRDAMVRAVNTYLPTATVHGAAAGLHLTITFDDGTDDVALAAAALRQGVKTHPLSWHCQLPYPPGLVLGYAARTPTEITEAIATIADANSRPQTDDMATIAGAKQPGSARVDR